MKVWRNAVGTFALTLLILVGFVPSANAVKNFVTPFSNHGVLSGSLGGTGAGAYITRLSRAFYSRGAAQDSAVYIVHNQESFAVGRLDVYSNVQDTVKSITVTDKNDAISNIDEVQIWVDTNGNGQWDPGTDTKVASSPAGLPFVGSGSDSLAVFGSFSQTLIVPANSHWKIAGGVPAATSAADSLSQGDTHLSLFVVYKTAQQVSNGSVLRAAFQTGSSGVVLSSVFPDTTNIINGKFNGGAGAWLSNLVENDSTSFINGFGYLQYAAGTYTVISEKQLPWMQLTYWSPALYNLGQPAYNVASQSDINVRILRIGMQSPDSMGTLNVMAQTWPAFGRTDTTSNHLPKGAQFDSLLSLDVRSENDNDGDVKTVKLWLKGWHDATNNADPTTWIPGNTYANSGDSLEPGDTLVAAAGGLTGLSAFTSGDANLVLGSGPDVGSIVSGLAPGVGGILVPSFGTAGGNPVTNGNTRWENSVRPIYQRRFLITYDMNPIGPSHNTNRLDCQIPQFGAYFSRSGYMASNNIAVDSAIVRFRALPFTVWIDTLATNRLLGANTVPDSTTNMHGLLVKGLIDIGDSLYNNGFSPANELAQLKVKNASTDIDSLIVDLRAFGQSMRYKLATNGWRPLGTDTVWSDTFEVRDPQQASLNDAYSNYYLGFSWDRYAADSYNRPTLTASNGNTGFLTAPDGPYSVATVGAINGKAFPKWHAYSHDLFGNVIVDSGWAPTGFPGDGYAGPYTFLPVDTWLPQRPQNVNFIEADSGKVSVTFNTNSINKDYPFANGFQATGKNPAGGAVLIYAQSNWTSGAPSGDINWNEPVDTIPASELNFSGFWSHRVKDIYTPGFNPLGVHLNHNMDYLFGFRARDNGGNLELNKFVYSTVADTLAPTVSLVSPTRQCGIYGPDSSYDDEINDSTAVENHHLFVYAVVDSGNGPDIQGGSVKLHIRVKDIDPSTPGDQPGPWDDPNIQLNSGSTLPVTMVHVGSSYWYTYEISSIFTSVNLTDEFELTVTAADSHGNTTTPDQAYGLANSILQGAQNHLCFVWDAISPTCELTTINGQEVSSGTLPVIDLSQTTTTFKIRVTDAVNDQFGLPYFVYATAEQEERGSQLVKPSAKGAKVAAPSIVKNAKVSPKGVKDNFPFLAFGWLQPDANHEVTVNFPTAALGTYSSVTGGGVGTFYFYLQDSAGNSCESEADYMIKDQIPPNATFVLPLNNARITLPYTIKVHATDNFALGAAVLTLWNHSTGAFMDTIAIVPRPAQAPGVGADYLYQYLWSKDVLYALQVGMADGGQYDIKATVYDGNNNTTTATTTFIYDGLAPTMKLEIQDPVVINGQTVVGNGTTVTFKATPSGPFATDVTKVDFWWKPVGAPDSPGSYTFIQQVNQQFSGAYWTSYSSFPHNDSVDVRVIAYDQSGNVAYDSDHDGVFDLGTLSTALTSTPPSALQFYTISTPDFAIWQVTDVNTGLVYYPSPKLAGEDGGNVSCAYALAGDSLYINPSVNSTNGNDVMAEYWLSGYGIGAPYFNTNSAQILLGHSTTSPYNFGFGLAGLKGLQEYLKVFGYWQGTLTMKVYDKFGNVTATDAICLGVTSTTGSQACVTYPTAGCVVYGDVEVDALVIDAQLVQKVRFEYKNLASGDWTPFDSMTTDVASDKAGVRGRHVKQLKIHKTASGDFSYTYTGTWHTQSLLPDGQYGLRAVAENYNGQVDGNPLNITVTLDNQGPSIADGPIPAWVGGGTNWTNLNTSNTLFQTLPLSATITRSIAKVNIVTWQVKSFSDSPNEYNQIAYDDNGAPWAQTYIFTPGNQTYWENVYGNNAPVMFRATMTDEACPPRTVVSDPTAKIWTDFTPPRCNWSTVNGQAVTNVPVDVTAGQNVPLVATAADDYPTAAVNSGLDSVAFRVYGNNVKLFDVTQAAGSNTSFTALWNTTGLTAGDYYVYFYAWDKQNNYCSSTVQVHVSDLAAPVASIGAITCNKIAAVSYDRDVDDVEIQMRAQGTTTWTNVGISTRILKGSLNAKQAKMLGRKVAQKLHSGNVPFTLWTTTFDGSALAQGNYEFRAIARDTASNSDPSLAPVATANLGGGTCAVTPVDGPAIQTISFYASEVSCDSALVQVTTDGSVSIPAVVVVEQTLNEDAKNSQLSVVAMQTNSINSNTFFGSFSVANLIPGGNAWVFAGGDNNLVTDLEDNGVTIFSVTPSLGSNSTISSIDGYMTAYFPPASVTDNVTVRMLPTDMPQPQPDNNRVRGVPNPAGTIECLDVCYYDGAAWINHAKTLAKNMAKGAAKTQGYDGDFAKPVVINLKYGTPVGANDASRLGVAWWDGTEWSVDGISKVSVNTATNTATAWVTYSACYAVIELDESCSQGTISVTDVRALPGAATAGAALQVPVNGYVDPRPCFSALIKDQFTNNNIDNVEVWLRPVGGNSIKLYDMKTSFVHCGMDANSGYEVGSGFLNLCYESTEEEGCVDLPGTDDGAFPAIKQGNYVLTVRASSKLGYCQTVEQTFNVDATGPVVTNLTPTYQGNNPVIVYSASDAGAGLSTKWQAVDLFTQEFDRDNATLKAPIYKGTFYLNNGITQDSSKTDAAGLTTVYYSAPTHFDLKEQDHLRAVVYGGRTGDWFLDYGSDYGNGTGPARQYIATGGVRDSLDNAAGPLEINTTIRATIGPGTVAFTPGAGTTGSCVGPNATFIWTVTGDMDPNSLVITYTNAVSGAVLATRHVSDVTISNGVVTDRPNLNLTNVTSVTAAFNATGTVEPRASISLSKTFTVDVTAPTFGTPTYVGNNLNVSLSDAGCGGLDAENITVTVGGTSHAFTYQNGTLGISGLNPGDQIVVHACDGVGNCADGNFVMESATLGFGTGLGAPHNYPNPFDNKANNTTTIVLGVTRSSSVEVRIFDLAGMLVKEYPARNVDPSATLVWDGRDSQGRTVARGVYLGQIKATDGSRTASAVIKIAVAR